MRSILGHHPSSLMKNSRSPTNNNNVTSPIRVYGNSNEQKESTALKEINEENRKLKEELNTAKLESDVKNYQLLLKDYQIQLMEKEKEITLLKSLGSSCQFTYGSSIPPQPSFSSFPTFPSFSAATGIYPQQSSSSFCSYPMNATTFPPLSSFASDLTSLGQNHLDIQRTFENDEYNESEEDTDDGKVKEKRKILMNEEKYNTMRKEGETVDEMEADIQLPSASQNKEVKKNRIMNKKKQAKKESPQSNDIDITNPNHHKLVYYTGTHGKAHISCRCCSVRNPFICTTCSDYFGFSIGICEKCYLQHFQKMISFKNIDNFKRHVNSQRKKRKLPLFSFDFIQNQDEVNAEKN
jgi:hypothetical protein